MLHRARLYAMTAYHLRPVQVLNRVWRKVRRPVLRGEGAPAIAARPAGWMEPVGKAQSLLSARRFTFLSQEADLDVVGWHAEGMSMLWAYNLHYFDDLTSWDAAERQRWHAELLADWIEKNPPGTKVSWDPYPISLRVVNIAKASFAGFRPEPSLQQSLADQLHWLDQSLEHHIQANHLFANAKALLFGAAFFEGKEPERWRKRGLRLALREIQEQWLEDGAHFELSPMYAALLAEDLADLYNLSKEAPWGGELKAAIAERWSAVMGWVKMMTHPDGHPAFFNDSAFAIAPSAQALEAYAERLGLPAPLSIGGFSAPSGYARLQKGDALLIADMAQVGPAHQPGHAHADTLSFELSLGCQRVIVNGGTSVYGEGPERAAERSTTAHATLELDDKNSSEVWAGFRVGRRARPRERQCRVEDDGSFTLRGSHDGYRVLAGKPIHRRCWAMSGGSLRITDTVSQKYDATHKARIVLPLHPDIRLERNDNREVTLLTSDNRQISVVASSPISIEACHWHPRFGVSLPSTRIVSEFEWSGELQHEFQIIWEQE